MGRRRVEQLNFRVTQQEREAILERMRACDFNDLSRYLRNISLNGYIINVDYSELKILISEIHKIGTNVNQIAHHANATGIVFANDVETIKMEIETIWQLLRSNLLKQP